MGKHIAEQFELFNMTPDDNIAEIARRIAHHWHIEVANQKRKYSGQPYTVHTDEVAAIYREAFRDDLVGVAIAHLHDSLEDTPLTAHGLTAELLKQGVSDNVIAQIVHGVTYLTDEYIREKHPTLNRKERKRLERDRIAIIPIREKNIKLADLISNSSDIVRHDPDFARVYLDEKEQLLDVLNDGDVALLAVAQHLLEQGRKVLGLTK